MTHAQLAIFAALAVAAARMARLYPLEKPGDLRDVDRIIHGPLWGLVQRAAVGAGGVHRLWRRGEQSPAALLAGGAGRWAARADRPTRRLAEDGVWIMAVLAGLLVLGLAFAS